MIRIALPPPNLRQTSAQRAERAARQAKAGASAGISCPRPRDLLRLAVNSAAGQLIEHARQHQGVGRVLRLGIDEDDPLVLVVRVRSGPDQLDAA